MRYFIILSLLFLAYPQIVLADTNAKSGIDSRVFEVPINADGPLVIEATFHLESLNKINDVEESVEFTGILTLTWKDSRQAFDPTVEGVKEKIFHGEYQFNELSPAWYPQVYLTHALEVHDKAGTILRVKPDGTSTLSEVIHAVARTNIQFFKYPFDSQRLEIEFQILGHDINQVVFQTHNDKAQKIPLDVNVPEWRFKSMSSSVGQKDILEASGIHSKVPSFIVIFDVKRQSWFILRLVLIPMMLITMLSWAVFWMERSSLGDRIAVSFVGILTTVSYQIFISGITPHFSYGALLNGILSINFLMMCSTVVINLWVGSCDKRGDTSRGDLIDYRCRWLYPLIYFGLIFILISIAFISS